VRVRASHRYPDCFAAVSGVGCVPFTEPLELLVVAVARDMETKAVIMRGGTRP
jgi:hypothetical protein